VRQKLSWRCPRDRRFRVQMVLVDVFVKVIVRLIKSCSSTAERSLNGIARINWLCVPLPLLCRSKSMYDSRT
jgi:hypothetical protein